MQTRSPHKVASSVLGVSLLLSAVSTVFAATGDTMELTGKGTLTIMQEGPAEQPDLLGTWTLFEPDNNKFVAKDKTFTFTEIDAGSYTFTSDIPQGATAAIEITVDGTLTQNVERQQATFPINGGQHVTVKITYSLTRVGTVAVNSKPGNLKFTLKGPNNFVDTGTTPKSYESMPEGLYTVYFDAIPNCITPKPKSDKLVKDGRIALSMEVACEGLKDIPQSKDEQTNMEYVHITVDGKSLLFTDAKMSEWFAPFVAKVVKTGIMGGYNDGNGNPTGKFGPGDEVTLAQLSKIAHRLAAIDETKVQVPVRNTRAEGQWFERFYASAEQQWWEVYRDARLDPSRAATRAEVVGTLLRALDVERVWAKGRTFADVLPTMPYADSIETAAINGLIDTESTSFRPNDPINRAEMAKLLSIASELYVETSSEIRGGSY